MPPWSTRPPFWPWVPAGVALVLALVAAVQFGTRGTASEAVAARQAPLVRTLQFSARVATLSRVDVGSTVTGRVAEVLVREGETARAGQVLVRLEAEEVEAAVAQARAGEQQAEARLAGLRSTGRPRPR
jgi:HlyD family secretion protein